MENDIKVIVQRGTHQIGGCCTEVATKNTRILIDFGTPLPEDEQKELSIEGITSGEKNCDGILITHYHGDHIGELENILSGIPIFMSKSAKEIVHVYKEHMGDRYIGLDEDNIRAVTDGKMFEIGDIKITPILSDHSSFQPFMYLLDIHGKRILHMGDFRLHGPHKDEILQRLGELNDIDLLITEGTTLSRAENGYTEEKVRDKFSYYLEKYKYCFLLTSSGNIDRIGQFAGCIKRGKYFLTDEFQKKLLTIASENDDECREYFKKVMTYGDNIKDRFENKGFGMIIRANSKFENIVRYYMTEHKDEACLIYSMWSGYREMPAIKKLTDIAGENCVTVHSSGHVVLQDLNDMINMLSPEQILFIHTETDTDNISVDLKERIVKLHDGKEILL